MRIPFKGIDLPTGCPNGFDQKGYENEPGQTTSLVLLLIVISTLLSIFDTILGSVLEGRCVSRPPSWREIKWRYSLPHWTESLKNSTSKLYRE